MRISTVRSTAALNQEREEIAAFYSSAYGSDINDVLFLNPRDPYEPWLNKEALTTICRQSPHVSEIGEEFYSES